MKQIILVAVMFFSCVFAKDMTQSDNKNREIIIGHSHQSRLLVISFTERFEVIRNY